jgi:hypothetical protein
MLNAPKGERRPLERLADLLHNFFRHADFTSSDVTVTLYLAAMLQRLERRDRVQRLLSAGSDSHATARDNSHSGTRLGLETNKCSMY